MTHEKVLIPHEKCSIIVDDKNRTKFFLTFTDNKSFSVLSVIKVIVKYNII